LYLPKAASPFAGLRRPPRGVGFLFPQKPENAFEKPAKCRNILTASPRGLDPSGPPAPRGQGFYFEERVRTPGRRRIAFFVDGFNVYHSLKDNPKYRQYLWIDYRRLAEMFVVPMHEKVSEVLYFTALAHWKPHSVQRHRDYIRALENSGVQTVYGKFKTSTEFCKRCRKEYPAHREKQSDLNVAIYLFRHAMEERYDRAVIVSADSDLVPAIKAAKEAFPGKQFYSLQPIRRSSNDLKNIADKTMYSKEKHLRAPQFTDEVVLADRTKVVRPHTWR
jgi:uncharacterized LabA/DUF88 family protein